MKLTAKQREALAKMPPDQRQSALARASSILMQAREIEAEGRRDHTALVQCDPETGLPWWLLEVNGDIFRD